MRAKYPHRENVSSFLQFSMLHRIICIRIFNFLFHFLIAHPLRTEVAPKERKNFHELLNNLQIIILLHGLIIIHHI